ncbi:MAG: AAA family ATPase, partial [Succinivibrio sp.]|nr:AAA family ATPase [Succinivibrio sp.]
MDFSSFTSSPYDLSIFREKFTALLRSYDKKYGMEPTQLEIDLPQTFDTFVSKLLEKYPGGFVLLIDEYDFNLNSLVDNNDLFEQFRLEIRNFYSKIKESKIQLEKKDDYNISSQILNPDDNNPYEKKTAKFTNEKNLEISLWE